MIRRQQIAEPTTLLSGAALTLKPADLQYNMLRKSRTRILV